MKTSELFTVAGLLALAIRGPMWVAGIIIAFLLLVGITHYIFDE